MCKQDIQIGRKTQARSVAFTSNAAAGTVLLPASSDRIGLILALAASHTLNSSETPVVGVRVGSVTAGVLGVNLSRPVDRATIVDLGELIRGEIVLAAPSANPCAMTVTEIVLTQALETI